MKRHNIILPSIGAFEQENAAYELVTRYLYVLPLVLILVIMLDLLLVWLYVKFGHPWREILEKETQVREVGVGSC